MNVRKVPFYNLCSIVVSFFVAFSFLVFVSSLPLLDVLCNVGLAGQR